MRLFNKVTIVGVGLIGGSLAEGIKKKKLAAKVIGVSRHKETLLLAQKKSIIDSGSQDIGITKDSDLVILATPINTIIRLGRIIAKIVKDDCIVSDVGSAKEEIVRELEGIIPGFVGAHPLAGSEKRGIANADSRIFKNSLCILTPTPKTNEKALKKIRQLWGAVGAKVIFLSPNEHDVILSFVSHMPHIVAYSLMGAVPERYLKFAPNSLKDTTRIAYSDIQIWQEIFLSNRGNIIKAIDGFEKSLGLLKSAIKIKDEKLISRILKQAKDKREKI